MAAELPQQLRLSPTARIKQGRDFARLKEHGRRLAVGCLLANWQPSPAGASSRVGVITPGKVGPAVARSRARRLLREVFRLHQHDLARPLDLVLVARPSIAGKRLSEVEKDFLTTLRKAGLLRA
jgi:ribonuclease P protein component